MPSAFGYMKLLLSVSALLSACASSPPAGTIPPALEPTIRLEANAPLPAAWVGNRPSSDAATVVQHGRTVTVYFQVAPACAGGVHAHRRTRGDTLRFTVHYGIEAEVADTFGCFTSCDFYCPILYRYSLATPTGMSVVQVALNDSLLATAMLDTQ